MVAPAAEGRRVIDEDEEDEHAKERLKAWIERTYGSNPYR
jgi:hypothetical protein